VLLLGGWCWSGCFEGVWRARRTEVRSELIVENGRRRTIFGYTMLSPSAGMLAEDYCCDAATGPPLRRGFLGSLLLFSESSHCVCIDDDSWPLPVTSISPSGLRKMILV